jgi:hypothetical protein
VRSYLPSVSGASRMTEFPCYRDSSGNGPWSGPLALRVLGETVTSGGRAPAGGELAVFRRAGRTWQ